VAEPQTAPLELRHRTIVRPRRITVGGVIEQRLGAEYFEHLLGVVLPVGRAMQIRARLQARHEQRDELRLDQPALVMARLVPRVREEDMHTVEAVRRDHLFEHFDRVVLDDADVRERLLAHQLQQGTDAGLVDFDAEEIVAGTLRRDFRGGRAHAEADLKYARRRAAEHAAPVGLLRREGHDEARAELVERAALTGRDAPRARDEAADAAAMQCFFRARAFRVVCVVERVVGAIRMGRVVAAGRREFVRQAGVVGIVDHRRCAARVRA